MGETNITWRLRECIDRWLDVLHGSDGSQCHFRHLLLTYLLTPRSRVLLEKLTVFHLVKKFPAFYRTRRFITAFTSARHLFLSWASSIQSITPHSISWTSILILSSHLCLGLPSGLSFPIAHDNFSEYDGLPCRRHRTDFPSSYSWQQFRKIRMVPFRL